MMEGPERIVCCSLCLCLAVAVFSSVALVYLTALVYMPAKREMMSALSDVPVVCTTVQRVQQTDQCDWYSCGEWCLSRSSQCVQLWAHVRKNGTDVMFEDCSVVNAVTCMVLDDDFAPERQVCQSDGDCNWLNIRFMDGCKDYDCGGGNYDNTNNINNINNNNNNNWPFGCDKKAGLCVSTRQYRNCKEDNVCTNLESLFLCKNGLCQNITSAYECSFSHTDPPSNCRDKRNCIALDGLFNCRNGMCAKWPWHCERRCSSAATGPQYNVLILSGDKMVSARCNSATKLGRSSERFWRSANADDTRYLLMASCTGLDISSKTIFGRDCVNGTMLPRSLLPAGGSANYTVVHSIFQRFGREFPMDPNGDKMPFDTDITIYNKTKLLINTEGCVNTLRYECTDFYLAHRRDGSNYSRRDSFPCYYTPLHSDFVTTRFSLESTRSVFLLSFAVPASLWMLSCSCLFACSKLMRVEDDGRMRLVCRKKIKVSNSDSSQLEEDEDEEVEDEESSGFRARRQCRNIRTV